MNTLKYIVGCVLAKLFPKLADEVRKNFTIPNYSWDGHGNFRTTMKKFVRFYLAKDAKAQEQQNPGGLEAMHREFWNRTDRYFSVTRNRTEEVHIPAYKDIVQELLPVLVERRIQTVCEFGTGDGRWLDYLSQQWPVVRNFVGIDISENQIEGNKGRYRHLTFVQADLLEWVAANAKPHTLYHTCGGVLEYLSEDSVRRLLQILKQQANGSLVFFIEPLYGSYDLTRDTASQIIGYEHSYTHNYVHLLEATGVTIIRREERKVMGYRNLIVLGCLP